MEKSISKNAQKILEKIRAGKFYRPYDPNRPAALSELQEAGLIKVCGRVVIIEAAFVPTTGYTPYVEEKFE